MVAYLVLVLAALSRFVPMALHGIGLNITAVGGGLLYFGSRRSAWAAPAGAAVMAGTDVYLTRFHYGYPFHLRGYALTWLWYAGVCLLGSGLLRRSTPWRVGVGVLCSATSFFVLSNLAVWAGGGLYPHTAAGLLGCYTLALPFYANDLVSTGLTAAVLFGLPAGARRAVEHWRAAARMGQPLS